MSVRVIARIRPLLPSEPSTDTILSANTSPENASIRIPNPRNPSESYTFHFNSVYPSSSTQSDLYDTEISPTIKSLFRGVDVTLFAYGVTGTGKTYTMRGGKALGDRGVIPRLLSGVFRRAKKVEKDSEGETKVDVSMSYYEIYCDRVYDLFEAPEKRTPAGLPIRDNGGKTVVVGLTERPCGTLREFEALYDAANVNRSTGATKLNAHSSRSHAILSVKITQTTRDQVRTSTVSAIDLAGSEDNRRTENSKDRMVESAAINKSLFVLAQCVEAISKKQPRIPYRESRMTRILSLGQNAGITVMILNLAPVKSYHLDTLSSLNFANRTKKIEVNEVENQPRLIPKGATSMQRQPLRPKNFSTNIVPRDLTEKSEKPVKSFAVYAEKPRPKVTSLPTKRVSSENIDSLRPSKVQRTSGLTAESIEAMIDRKVSEKLASAAMSAPASKETQLSREVQARLDALEKRVDTHEFGSEGLQFLLMGKQHHAREEWSSALKCYELAVPYFPDNEKLRRKIAKMHERLRVDREEPAKHDRAMEGDFEDESFRIDGEAEVSEDESFSARKTKRKDLSTLVADTPRSKELLRIINSRDVEQIRLLKGVGVKKAETIVQCLSGEGQARLESFADLERVRGLGIKGLEKMREGIAVC